MKIELKNITKSFDGNIIIDDCNITMHSGKIYGFIGRNGSGKSVLFKLICGLYTPTKGEILYNGEKINDSFLPDCRALIEKPTFLPNLSGLENLKLLASIQNKITESDIEKTLDVVNLSKEERNKKFHKYSLGMKQKIGIAQVLMENPKIMIFDEPFNGIEKESLKKISDYIKSKSNKDTIIIIASHIEEDIKKLANVVYEIDGGKVKEVK